jgi:type VI secretion system (T6SS) effector TldE1-like protein
MWTYEQKTGHLDHNGLRHTTGYSGHAEGKNNPALQDHPSLGPIPRGAYTLQVIVGLASGSPCDYEGKKAPVFRILPKPGTNTFGRSGFLIHGDSVSAPGTASLGCVIENHGEREAILESGDTDFEVV